MADLFKLLPSWAQTVAILLIAAAIVAWFLRDLFEKFSYRPVKEISHPIQQVADQVLPKTEGEQTFRQLVENLKSDVEDHLSKVDHDISEIRNRFLIEAQRNEREFRRAERIETEQSKMREAIETIRGVVNDIKEIVVDQDIPNKRT